MMAQKNNKALTFFMLFIPLLLIEVVADFFLLPADEVLVPAEIIGDAAMLALVIGASLFSR